MKIFLPIFLFFYLFSPSAISQVGIGNTDPAATLDIYGANYDFTLDEIGGVAENDGVLVPRVSDLLISGLNEGQLVYLVDDVAPSKNGFYYWDGAAWTAFKSFNASGAEAATVTPPDAVIPGTPTASMAFTNATSVAIPDLGSVAPTVTVSGVTGVTTAITAEINITHTWVGDLMIYLEAPTGEILELSHENGGSGNNYTNTIFDDAGSTNITAGTAPFSGTFRPEGTLDNSGAPLNTTATISTMSGFNGLNPNGTWTLWIGDGAGGDIGTFDSFTLNISGSSQTDWVLIGEVSLMALTSHALIVQSTYSGDTSDTSGVITALTRSEVSAGSLGTSIDTLPGSIENYASAAPNNSGNVWVNTTNQTRNVGLTNNTIYFYQLWRKGNIETPIASNETFSIIPMRLKE